MLPIKQFETRLPLNLKAKFNSLKTPHAIQEYLDSLPYLAEELDRSPLRVMQDGQCHCLDGGIFAALALAHIGFPALILDLVPQPHMDDDHVLAIFKINGLWSAIAKSNYANLRYREPVYRSLRELAMSYFEHFFNAQHEKTLRAYTRPMDLATFRPYDWMWDEEALKALTKKFYGKKPIPLIKPKSAADLSPVDERAYKSGTLGTDPDWIFGAH